MVNVMWYSPAIASRVGMKRSLFLRSKVKCLLTLCVLVVDLLTTFLIFSKEPLCQFEAK